MKNRLIISGLFLALSTFVWTGCIRENVEGPAGRDGMDGRDGRDGQVQVYYSGWYDIKWVWDSKSEDWYSDFSNNAITKDIVENGVILAYISLPNDLSPNTIRPLPTKVWGYDWNYIIPDFGVIELTSNSIEVPISAGCLFRFVLIPSGIAVKSALLKSTSISDLHKMPYKDVCKLLGIPE